MEVRDHRVIAVAGGRQEEGARDPVAVQAGAVHPTCTPDHEPILEGGAVFGAVDRRVEHHHGPCALWVRDCEFARDQATPGGTHQDDRLRNLQGVQNLHHRLAAVGHPEGPRCRTACAMPGAVDDDEAMPPAPCFDLSEVDAVIGQDRRPEHDRFSGGSGGTGVTNRQKAHARRNSFRGWQSRHGHVDASSHAGRGRASSVGDDACAQGHG